MDIATPISVGDAVEADFGGAAEFTDLGLRGDVTHGARAGSRAEQGALRSAQHFDAVEVVEIEVRREQRHGDRRFIQIDADGFLHTGLIAHHLAGADATDGNLALTWAKVGDVQAGHIARHLDDVGGAGFLMF